MVALMPTAGVLPAVPAADSVAVATTATNCHGVIGSVREKTAMLTGHTTATTGGSGTIEIDSKGTGDLATWVNGGTATLAICKSAPAKKDHCSAGAGEVHLAAKVTGRTGSSAAISDPVPAFVCIPTSGKGKVVPASGTVWKF